MCNKIKNKQGINKIRIEPSAYCFCPLGNAWYNIEIEIDMNVDKYYPNYCDIKAFIDKEIQGKSLIIEDVIDKVYAFMLEYEPDNLIVGGTVADIDSHPPVKVTKYM